MSLTPFFDQTQMIDFFLLAQEYEQQEYGMGYLLVAGMIVLGLLVVCVPRPRRSDFADPEEERRKKVEKTKAKREKQKAKKKKKKEKQKLKAQKKKT